MKAGMSQRQSAGQGFVFQAKLANMLEMPGREYAELIREIEADPIFIKLKYADNAQERAIHMRRLKQSDLSHRFLELDESTVSQDTGPSAEVEKLLEDKQWLVNAVRKIGEDEFKRLFIYNEGDISPDEIAESCRLKPSEVKQIFSLINSVDVFSEFFIPSPSIPEKTVSYNKIAVLVPRQSDYVIQFLSAHWARGVYDVDYDKIKRMTESGAYSKTQKDNLKKLLAKIELVNIRKSLMGNILLKTIEKQKNYFDSGGESDLEPFKQTELAKDLGVHPSIVSRGIAGRSIETPWGLEKPLKEFFPSGKLRQKEVILGYIHEILKKEKAALRSGILKKPFSDKAISLLLQNEHSEAVAPRTVAKYRNQMQLPPAFLRGKP
jgi:DNA-directed RNA polymerase specialized sigma54-like protein